MRTLALVAGLAVIAAVVTLWLTGGLDALSALAVEAQRLFQNRMAGALRGLKAGDAGALLALLALAFGYGFFHAAGPGHGKFLIGGYGVGSRVRVAPLIGIALASSLAQATTAVGLVYAGVLALNWTRDRMVGLTENVMAPISYAAIALIGGWLVWRGARGLWRQGADAPGHIGHDAPHREPHDGHGHDAACGHKHGPTAAEVAGLRGWRDAALLIATVAIRPCTGALFLLILTWQLGIAAAGIAGAYVMALGTASVTVAVAVLSVLARDGALMTGGRLGAARAVAPVLEIGAGLVVMVAAFQLLLPLI